MIPKELFKQEVKDSLTINKTSSLAYAEAAFNTLPDLLPKEELARVIGLEGIGGGVELGRTTLQSIAFDPATMQNLGTQVAEGIQGGVQTGTDGMNAAGANAGNVYGQSMKTGIETGGREAVQEVENQAAESGEKVATQFQGPMKKKAEDMRKAFETEFKAIGNQFKEVFAKTDYTKLSEGLTKAVFEPVSLAVEEIQKLAAPEALGTSMQAVGEAAKAVADSGLAKEIKDAQSASGPFARDMRAAQGAISRSVGPANSLARALERAAAAAERAARARFSGGPVEGGQTYTVNEFGKEMFMSNSGQLREINAPAFGNWTAPSSGQVIPAHIANEIRAQGEASKAAAAIAMPGSGAAAARRSNSVAHSGGPNYPKQMLKELKNLNQSGGATTNNIQIQSQQPVQDASQMLLKLNQLKRLRRGR